jgi:hypothetical protein
VRSGEAKEYIHRLVAKKNLNVQKEFGSFGGGYPLIPIEITAVKFLSREMVKWRRYINHNKQKQLWDLTFVTIPSITLVDQKRACQFPYQ